MEKLARSLLEELNVETVFTIPLFGGIPVSESVVVTWIAMAVLIVIAFLLGRNLKVRNPGKRQQIAELIVLKLDAFTKKTLGEEATEYSTYMAVVLLFIGFVNLIGVFGFKPPTKDLNVPAALALMRLQEFVPTAREDGSKDLQNRWRFLRPLIFWKSLFDRFPYVCVYSEMF